MYLAEISRHSISSPSAINLSRYSSKWSDHSSNKWNISFNFPKVKTGESLVLKGLHLSASSLKRCSDNGSTYKICVDILANLRNAFYRRTGELNWRKIFERLFTFRRLTTSTIFYRHFLRYISKVHFGKQRTETKSNKYCETMEHRRFDKFVCFASAKLSYWLTRWLSSEFYTYYFQSDQGET